eukprot:4618808-Alexandrium_andersonii.AAC.1
MTSAPADTEPAAEVRFPLQFSYLCWASRPRAVKPVWRSAGAAALPKALRAACVWPCGRHQERRST